MILITGATGHLGSAVIDSLLKQTNASDIVALVRSEEKGQSLKEKSVNIKIGSYDDIASLEKAMQGVDKVLLISGMDEHRLEQHKNVVNAAKQAGVKLIGYTSVALTDWKATDHALMNSHFETEEYIKESGVNYAFFRNTLYADVLPMFLGEQVFERGIFLPAGDGKVQYVLRTEMAEGIANSLVSDNVDHKVYDIVNTRAYSFADIAAILSDLAGKNISYTAADTDAFISVMQDAGVPDYAIDLTVGFCTDIKNDVMDVPSNDLKELLGREPKDLKQSLKEIYSL